MASGGQVFLSTSDGLYALDGQTGQNDLFYFTTWSGQVQAIDAINGQRLWTIDLGPHMIVSSPLVSEIGLLIYAGSYVQAVRIFDE